MDRDSAFAEYPWIPAIAHPGITFTDSQVWADAQERTEWDYVWTGLGVVAAEPDQRAQGNQVSDLLNRAVGILKDRVPIGPMRKNLSSIAMINRKA